MMLGVVIDDTESADRVRAQQAVSAQLARALELAKVAVWRVDLQAERIHLNDVGYQLAGMPSSDTGAPLDDVRVLMHPDDRLAAEEAVKQAVAGSGVVDVETRVRVADGSYRYMLTRRVAERNAEGHAVALTGVSLDQTERIAERERAQALARRIQLVADAAGVGIWTIENPGEGAAERVEWNAQMFHIYGLSPDQAAPPVREMDGRSRPLGRPRTRWRRSGAARGARAGSASRPAFASCDPTGRCVGWSAAASATSATAARCCMVFTLT